MAPILTETQRADYHKAVDEFLNSSSTTHLAFRTGLDFHKNIDLANPSSSFTQDVESRLDRARQALHKIVSRLDPEQTFDMNAMHLSFFLTFDDDFALEDIIRVFNVFNLKDILDNVEPFLSTCRGRSAYLDRNPPPSSQGEKRRQRKEAEAALARDNSLCVVTKSSEPEVAHIIPYTVNKSDTHFHNTEVALRSFLLKVHPELFTAVKELLVERHRPTSEPVLSCSDKPFNMVSLNRQLHWYWDRAICGLMPIDELIPRFNGDIALIRVEWRWLPKKFSQALAKSDHVKSRPSQRHLTLVDLDSPGFAEFIRDTLQENDRDVHDSDSGGGDGNGSTATPLGHLLSGRRIESGYRFDLRAAKEDAQSMRALLKLQWLAVRMACISGAADFVDDLRETPPDDAVAIQKTLLDKCQQDTARMLQAMRDEEEEGQDNDTARPPSPEEDKKKQP